MRNYLFVLMLIALTSCTKNTNYYTLNDFEKVDKIDVHIHINTNRDVFVEQARKDNFRLLNIVVDISNTEEEIVEKYNYRLDTKTRYPEVSEFATSFSMQKWDDPDWLKNTMNWLDKGINEGAVGVKVWKNIGMVFKDKNGVQVMIDDPKFDAIFKMLTKRKITLIGHLGEPKNCWLPLDEMTTNNDKKYFKEYPQYHMYKHPDLPSYEEQIAARDRMLDKNPDLVFMGVHLGSLEWSVDELAKRLDKYPNMSVDMAARIGQLFYQTKEDREKVRQFFIKYQDRLLYGTDLQDFGKMSAIEKQTQMHDYWIRDWEYFVTNNIMTSELLDGEFQGLHLPKEVVDKIYFKNARKWLKMFPNQQEK
ncbi:MAG: amidohydrolase [Flavobacteriaceae bacterium]|nr:amidohydrolase [Flavobacteriaceae bacterium]